MLGAVCHDFGKPVDHRRSSTAVSGPSATRRRAWRPATAFLDRLNIHSIDGVDVRTEVLGIVAHHLKPGMWHKVREEVGDGAFRRLAQKVNLELLAVLAKADCTGREPDAFDCSAMDWFLERARALGVEHQPPPRLVLGPAPVAARRHARARHGTAAAGDLRDAARWRGDDDGGRGRSSPGGCWRGETLTCTRTEMQKADGCRNADAERTLARRCTDGRCARHSPRRQRRSARQDCGHLLQRDVAAAEDGDNRPVDGIAANRYRWQTAATLAAPLGSTRILASRAT